MPCAAADFARQSPESAQDFVTIVSGPMAMRQASQVPGAIPLPQSLWPGSVAWPVGGAFVQVLDDSPDVPTEEDRLHLLVEALLRDGAREVQLVRVRLQGLWYRSRWRARE